MMPGRNAGDDSKIESGEVGVMASCKGAAGRSGRPSSDQKPGLLEEPAADRVLRTISATECFGLLEPGGIGRVGFTTADGVIMLPVNFAMCGKTIIFRTAPDSLLALHTYGHLSFEADHVEEPLGEGWSVLVLGQAHPVTDEREVQHLEDATRLQPWAPGARDVYIRIAPTHISGRSIQPR
jgi:nitroimidazol reductase NimA-like FMN-containing flavoprotein (pyridoxamine 5'-phosphate oxidase superfamily)